jgi:NADH dehydrogenase
LAESSHHIVPHHIVIVGGGAGGLVLATKLGNRLGRRGRAQIVLIDSVLTHIWKPLLHEVAVGTMGPHNDDVNFLGHARDHHFAFQPGRMVGLDRKAKEVHLAPILDPDGLEVTPARQISYDTLVIAVGSTSNDFGIPGVAEHCLYLDSYQQADRFQQRLLSICLRAQFEPDRPPGKVLRIAIVGAGATGVELSAEMHKALRHLSDYGLDRIDVTRDVEISLVEAAPRVLPNLPERLSEATEKALKKLGIQIHSDESVVSVSHDGITTRSGHFLPAEIKVWSAGVKAADFLRDLDGLETNRINQLVVLETLQTTRDGDVFAMGDCAACPQPGSERPVPPRAQAAYQQAMLLAGTLEGRLKGRPPRRFVYRDYGSLISLSYSSVGNLMGNLLGSVMLEGMIARLAYLSLYKKHQLALHGFVWVAFATLANLIKRRTEPRLKLH